MKGRIIIPVALGAVFFGVGQPVEAANRPVHHRSVSVASTATCQFVGFTIDGTTNFLSQPSWQSLKFVQRLDGVSTTIVVGWTAMHDPVTLYGIDSTETEALSQPTNYLSVSANHSGVAIYAC